MDIPLDPILSSHRGTRNAKKVTTLLNIINLLTNYTRRLYMYVMTNETYVDVKSNIIYTINIGKCGVENMNKCTRRPEVTMNAGLVCVPSRYRYPKVYLQSLHGCLDVACLWEL